MNKEFVPYEQALKLKEIDFDEPCYKYVYVGDTGTNVDHYLEVEPSKAKNYNEDDLCISQPTFSQAFRWFREKYDIDIDMDVVFSKHDDGISLKNYKVLIPFHDELFINVGLFTTYEEAELECLKKLIKIQGGNK